MADAEVGKPTPATATAPLKKKKKPQHWRPWLRAMHRDIGYVAVGLTFVYAGSGLAVNHIGEWDPNFQSYDTTHEVGPLAGDAKAVAAAAMAKLGIAGDPEDAYASAPDQVDISLGRRTLHVNPLTGHVVDQGTKPR